MKLKLPLFLIFAIFSITLNADSTADSTSVETYSEEELLAQYYAFIDSVQNSFDFQTGIVDIKNGLAQITVPQGFKYLNPTQSETVLVDIWGNPPGEGDEQTLGMLFPENATLLLDSTYAIDITYSEEGYIDDSDAKDIDYDELLTEMISDTKLASEQRVEMGYESIEMIGWASPPFYDSANKKLHWAKELKFGTSEINTLNYNIRILGRKGFLNLNAIADIGVLEKVKNDIDPIINSVNFNKGYRYSDFNPDLDKVAAYGIGGLIAGKVLAKAGFFTLIAKFWKLIALGAVAAFAGIRKLISGRKEDDPIDEVPSA